MERYKNILLELIVTCFFVGKIKCAPGTFGSLIAFPLSMWISSSVMKSNYRIYIDGLTMHQNAFVTIMAAMLLVIIVLFVVGTVCSSIYIKQNGVEDPKEVVIDEVVGQMLAVALSSLSVAFLHQAGLDLVIAPSYVDWLCLFIMPFILFRWLDISKPFPIDWVDKNVGGGLGVMLDDVLAGIFAAVLQYFCIFCIIDLWHYYFRG